MAKTISLLETIKSSSSGRGVPVCLCFHSRTKSRVYVTSEIFFKVLRFYRFDKIISPLNFLFLHLSKRIYLFTWWCVFLFRDERQTNSSTFSRFRTDLGARSNIVLTEHSPETSITRTFERFFQHKTYNVYRYIWEQSHNNVFL